MTSSPFADRHPLKEKRKANKPLLERKRRARINDSLKELKQLVLFSLNKDTSRFSKMEKADILDMTVQFLRAKKLQPTKESAPTSYQAGFNECANEIIRYVMTMNEIDHTLKARLLSHLASSCQMVDPIQPISSSNGGQTSPVVSPTMWSHCLPPSPTDMPSTSPTSFPSQPMLPPNHLHSGTKPLAPRRHHPHYSLGGKQNRSSVKLEQDYTTQYQDKSIVWRPW